MLPTCGWADYRSMVEGFGERHLRLAYDGENLEIMTVSRRHDKVSRLMGRFVVVLTEELGLPLDSAGSLTLDEESVNRGVEPDECFYIVNEPKIRDKDEINLANDPAPDLAMEIDISRSSLNRMQIYAALRVPEVWRSDGDSVHIFQLGSDGKYVRSDRSRYFPGLNPADLASFMRRRGEMDENALVAAFRAWVRQQIASGWGKGS